MSVSNELGGLTGSIQDIVGRKEMSFVSESSVPQNKKVTYVNMVCGIRPKNDDVY